MDWVGNAKTYRDNAIAAFQNIDNAPQVRARAYIYADVMHQMLDEKEPRPKAIPSHNAYQCSLNAVVLKSYIEHRQAVGGMSFKADEFIAWADNEREGPSMELLGKTIECMIKHMQVFGNSYEGTFIGSDEIHELNRTLAIHAFAVITASFLELERLGDDAPLMHLLLEVSPSEWHLEEYMLPLLPNIRAVFSVEQGSGQSQWEEIDTAPSIAGFLLPETMKVLFIEPDQEEVERLTANGEAAKTNSQVQLNANIVSTRTALEGKTYPSFPGHEVTIQVVSNKGILPRQDDTETDESEDRNSSQQTRAIDIRDLPDPPDIFKNAYADAMKNMGVDNPHLVELRTRLDYAIFTGNARYVLAFFGSLGDKADEMLPPLRYGKNPLTQALAKQVYGNDDFFGATVFNLFAIDPQALYGDRPLTRALDEQQYEIACAIATHEGNYSPAKELGASWVNYREALSEAGAPYFTWQMLNCIAFSAGEDAHAAAIASIADSGEEKTYQSYHKQMAQSFLLSGGPFKVASDFFNSQAEDDSADD